jgi:hypothetical protein
MYREYETSAEQDAILRQIWALSGPGVALLDLDGCLFDTRWRQMAILAAFAEKTGWYDLARVRPEHFRDRDLAATLAVAGVRPSRDYRAIRDYWDAHFFDEVDLDHPLPGSARLVRRLAENGLSIVYLTGRHQGVTDRTRRGLVRNGFPWDGTALLDKPSVDMTDHDHKLSVLASLSRVRVALENEPIQLQSMADRFPLCLPVLVETDNSGRPAMLPEHTARIRGFLLSADLEEER